MSVAGSLALAVAERVERTAGTRAGLVAWRTLAGNAADAEVRGRALVAALRCAVELRDRDVVNELVALWKSVDRGVWDAAIIGLCKAMAKADLLTAAVDLAAVEARCRRSARVLYLHARCLELARGAGSPRTTADAEIVAILEDTIRRAENEGARDVERAARVRRAAILARSWPTRSAAVEEAQRVDLPSAPVDLRLTTVRVLLGAPSRFVRALALDALDGLVTEGGRAADRALRVAARFADDGGASLSGLEVDRLLALFGRDHAAKIAPRAREQARRLGAIATASDGRAREDAIAAVVAADPALAPSLTRVREILQGRFEVAEPRGTPPADPEARRHFRQAEILDLVVALRDSRPASAVRALRSLADAAAAGERLPSSALAAGERALASEDAGVRLAAGALFEALLRHPGVRRAPGGFLSLGAALLAAGFEDAALRARRSAVAAREPGASEALGTMLARGGWELARAGDRAAAIARLREAKRIFS
jgi:hypothetical protein